MAGAISAEMLAVSEYVAGAANLQLTDLARERARFHILDTIAAMVSGSRLLAGERARSWSEGQSGGGGGEVATIIGSGRTAAPFVAALCNGMSAHADETDDSHAESHSHPGCAVVPAALAAGEAVGASGEELLRAVVIGYDIGCRASRAAGLPRLLSGGGRSSHPMVGIFGSAAAGSALYRFSPVEVRYALSYTAQLCSGVTTWMRDTQHVEKAYVFGGMPASQAMLALSLVRSGFNGVEDVFSGKPSWLDGLSPRSDRSRLAWKLGEEFEITLTTLKKYAVGSPAQAAVEGILQLVTEHGLRAQEVEAIVLRLPSDEAFIVDSREMPNINAQYLVAGSLLDGRFSFEMAHDEARLRSPEVRDLLARITLVPDTRWAGVRAAELEVTRTSSGGSEKLLVTITDVRGRPTSPMSAGEVRDKSMDLMAPVLGSEPATRLCDLVLDLESIPDVRSLTTLIR